MRLIPRTEKDGEHIRHFNHFSETICILSLLIKIIIIKKNSVTMTTHCTQHLDVRKKKKKIWDIGDDERKDGGCPNMQRIFMSIADRLETEQEATKMGY